MKLANSNKLNINWSFAVASSKLAIAEEPSFRKPTALRAFCKAGKNAAHAIKHHAGSIPTATQPLIQKNGNMISMQ